MQSLVPKHSPGEMPEFNGVELLQNELTRIDGVCLGHHTPTQTLD